MDAGGIATHADQLREEYRSIPNTYKRRDGLPGDEMAEYLAMYHPELGIETENDLIEVLSDYSNKFSDFWSDEEDHPLEIITNPPDPESYQKFLIVDGTTYFWKTSDPSLNNPTHSDAAMEMISMGADEDRIMDHGIAGRNYGDYVEVYTYGWDVDEDAVYQEIINLYPDKPIEINGENYGEKSLA